MSCEDDRWIQSSFFAKDFASEIRTGVCTHTSAEDTEEEQILATNRKLRKQMRGNWKKFEKRSPAFERYARNYRFLNRF